MYYIGQILANAGYTLRSGGASGADEIFEQGCDSKQGKKEIYLPWKNFNNNKSELYNIPGAAFSMAERIHPAWNKCTEGTKKLHARNVQQVLGPYLNESSLLLICWTKDGKATGGTATAINLARECKTPVYNLYNETDEKELFEFLKNMKKV